MWPAGKLPGGIAGDATPKCMEGFNCNCGNDHPQETGVFAR